MSQQRMVQLSIYDAPAHIAKAQAPHTAGFPGPSEGPRGKFTGQVDRFFLKGQFFLVWGIILR
ncbi:MAG: hypothetical protein ACLPYB_07720 [Desulfobaccales bacterium]